MSALVGRHVTTSQQSLLKVHLTNSLPATACTRGNIHVLDGSSRNSDCTGDIVIGTKLPKSHVDDIQPPLILDYSPFQRRPRPLQAYILTMRVVIPSILHLEGNTL